MCVESWLFLAWHILTGYTYNVWKAVVITFLFLGSNLLRTISCIAKRSMTGLKAVVELSLVISLSERQGSTFCDVNIAIIRYVWYLLTHYPVLLFYVCLMLLVFCPSFVSFFSVHIDHVYARVLSNVFLHELCVQHRTFYRELVACRSSNHLLSAPSRDFCTQSFVSQ